MRQLHQSSGVFRKNMPFLKPEIKHSKLLPCCHLTSLEYHFPHRLCVCSQLLSTNFSILAFILARILLKPYICSFLKTLTGGEWMTSSPDPPCWWHLVRALRERMVDEGAITTAIERKHSKFNIDVELDCDFVYSS